MSERLVLVCGGRDLHPTHDDAYWLRAWLLYWGAGGVMHGDGPHRCEDIRCRRDSTDRWAGRVALRLGLRAQAFPPEGPRPWPAEAFTRRNLAMLDASPIGVLAIPGKRGALHRPGSGTGHTVHHARARGLDVVIRMPDGPWPPGVG